MSGVRDNKAQSRFEIDVEGGLAFATYCLAPGAVIITHTETSRSGTPVFRQHLFPVPLPFTN